MIRAHFIAVSFALIAFLINCEAGVDGIRDRAVSDLEDVVSMSGNSVFEEDLIEIKYLKEKVVSLQSEGKTKEAEILEKRVKRKIELLHQELSHSSSGSDTADANVMENYLERESVDRMRARGSRGSLDAEERLRDREERKRQRDAKMKEREAIFSDRFRNMNIEDFDDESYMHPDMYTRSHDLSRERKDITERHQELIDHRQKDITARIESAGFSPDEEERLKQDLADYLAIEKEVMESRASDRSSNRKREGRKSKEERMQDKEAMKARRNHERARMEEAREKRKQIDSTIREKLTAGREL